MSLAERRTMFKNSRLFRVCVLLAKLKHLEINLKLLRFPVMSKRKKRREHSQKLTMF